MAEMPTLGRSRKRPAGPAVAVAVVIVLVALLAWWRLHKKSATPMAPTVSAPPPTPAPGNPAPPAPVAAATVNDDGGTPAAHESAKPAHSAADDELEKAGFKRLRVEVNGPLETAVVGAVGPELGPRLVQVLVRSLVWWLSVP
ncbi:MAG TPA: hypothetical protein VGL86_07960, partial [Polyangia bacterium]